MKKVFVLACIANLIIACNNNANDNNNHNNGAAHSVHDTTSSGTQGVEGSSVMKAEMDKMMHEMHSTKHTGNNDVDFAKMMMAHHKGAVQMSEVELAKGDDAELKKFAKTVIQNQDKEIAMMETFISTASKAPSPDAANFQKALSECMMAMMNNTTIIYNNIDKDYAAQMIPHHQSAVDMAKAYLRFGKEASLVSLCQNIIHSQAKEIIWLKDWLSKNK